MNLGAEPKKVAILIGLAVVGAGLYLYNSSGDSAPTPPPRSNTAANTPAVLPSVRTAKAPARPSNGEFRIRVEGGRPDDQKDPASIDPELRLDLLAKVQAVQPIEAGRNLFQFGVAPPPDKPIPAVPTGVPPIPITRAPVAPPPPVVNQTPQPPPIQPLSFKYYGILVSKANGRRQAFLQDGDDILFAQENEVIKQHYRIVKIAPASIDIEDTQAKNTQTLKLQDLPPS